MVFAVVGNFSHAGKALFEHSSGPKDSALNRTYWVVKLGRKVVVRGVVEMNSQQQIALCLRKVREFLNDPTVRKRNDFFPVYLWLKYLDRKEFVFSEALHKAFQAFRRVSESPPNDIAGTVNYDPVQPSR